VARSPGKEERDDTSDYLTYLAHKAKEKEAFTLAIKALEECFPFSIL
jgi:predicted type IV restriction endonuclease